MAPKTMPALQRITERPLIQTAVQKNNTNNLAVGIKSAKLCNRPVLDVPARQVAFKDRLSPGKRRMAPQQVAPRIQSTVGSIGYIKKLSADLGSDILPNDIREKVNNLGNVSESKLSYFESTRASKACAKEFF